MLEAWIAKRSYHVDEHLLREAGLANLWSTFVGVPLAWLALLPIAIASDTKIGDAYHRLEEPFNLIAESIIGMAWLPPYGPRWMVPLATTAFLIPAFFFSVLIERRELRHVWKSIPAAEVNSAAWKINLYSYAFLLVLGIAWIVLELCGILLHIDAFPFVN